MTWEEQPKIARSGSMRATHRPIDHWRWKQVVGYADHGLTPVDILSCGHRVNCGCEFTGPRAAHAEWCDQCPSR